MATFRARKTSDGKTHHEAIVRLKGHPRQSATFPRLSDAKRWAAATEAEIRNRRHFGRSAETSSRTLEEAVDLWVREASGRLKSHKEVRDRLRHLAWWCEQMPRATLREVSPATISALRDRLGDGRSPATVNRYLASLSRVFSLALQWEWCESNPVGRVTKRREPSGRTRFLDAGEQERLIDAAYEPLRSMIVLAIATGMRQGELVALRWGDVDIERRLALARDTKNGENRSVPLNSRAVETLRSLQCGRRSDRVLSAYDHKAWQRALRRAEIEGLRFHDLRHTAASHLAMAGATPLEVAAILGHKTLAMVKRYSHFFSSHLADVSERASVRFLGTPPATS